MDCNVSLQLTHKAKHHSPRCDAWRKLGEITNVWKKYKQCSCFPHLTALWMSRREGKVSWMEIKFSYSSVKLGAMTVFILEHSTAIVHVRSKCIRKFYAFRRLSKKKKQENLQIQLYFAYTTAQVTDAKIFYLLLQCLLKISSSYMNKNLSGKILGKLTENGLFKSFSHKLSIKPFKIKIHEMIQYMHQPLSLWYGNVYSSKL